MLSKIGLDVELVCNKDGEYIPAHNIFSRSIGTSGQFGLDGSPRISEMRPNASENIIEVVTNIYTALKYVDDLFTENNVTLHSGHYKSGQAIGSHIHFGNGEENIAHRNEIVKYLNFFLDELISPATDNMEEKAHRRNSGYGRLGDIRSKPYGFEYRTPGSFIHNPELTMVYFTIAKLASIAASDTPFDFSKYTTTKSINDNVVALFDAATASMGRQGIRDDIADCVLGMSIIKRMFRGADIITPVNWNDNILDNWRG